LIWLAYGPKSKHSRDDEGLRAERMSHSTNPLFLGLPSADLEHVLGGVQRWEMLRGQRLLLTGATGFIGKWLLGTFLYANRALGLDAKLVLLSRDVLAFQALHPELREAPEIEWLQGDVRNFALSDAQRCGFTVHAATDVAASQVPSHTFDTCVRGTANVLTQMRHSAAKRLLLLSSGAVYGRTPPGLGRIPEEWTGAPDCLSTASAYAEGKRSSELLCAMAAAEQGLSIPIARCFAFVGPYLPLDKHFAIGNFISAALRGEPLQIQGDGTPLRSYLYAADMALWLWTMLFEGQSARAYNVGGEESLSIGDLAHRVVAAIGAKSPVQIAQMPEPDTPVQAYVPDLRRAETELGLRSHFDLNKAIQRTARWAAHDVRIE
jgi:nucleoside-diphosphate-sugar epimerase